MKIISFLITSSVITSFVYLFAFNNEILYTSSNQMKSWCDSISLFIKSTDENRRLVLINEPNDKDTYTIPQVIRDSHNNLCAKVYSWNLDLKKAIDSWESYPPVNLDWLYRIVDEIKNVDTSVHNYTEKYYNRNENKKE